ncbi:MAG: signal transduction histidine kinase [Planctomycetota bacterium]|jgi:signal transduction histidine kinase
MTAQRSKLTWFLALVLFSAAGLVAFGLLGLQKSAKKARATARQEAERAASSLARSLTQSVRDPSFLSAMPQTSRFELNVDGQLVIPPRLGWIKAPSLRDINMEPGWLALKASESAQKQEFVAHDLSAAIATLEQAAAESESEFDHGFLLARGAWTAHRAQDTKRRSKFLEQFWGIENVSPRDKGAAIRLESLVTRSLSSQGERYLLHLPPESALAFVDRLSSLGKTKVSDLHFKLRSVHNQRQSLLLVMDQLESLRAAKAPVFRKAESQLLIYFPQKNGGRGVVIEPASLVSKLGFEANRFHVGPVLPKGAIAALPMIAVPVTEVEDGEGWTDSGFVPFLLGLLALTLCLGLFLTLRAVRREALAAQSRTDFLTSVTHELKTPLASIRLLAEMLESDMVPDEDRRKEYHRLLSGESARLTMLIENVLDLGRMERGERAYDKRPCQLQEIIEEAVALFAPIAKRDGMSVEVDLKDQDEMSVVDRGAMVQVLLNLLENAKKYAKSGQVVELYGAKVGDHYRLLIRDYGPGIPESERTVVFERFQRGAAQSDGRIAGVGLGLYLARRILRDHDGDLKCIAAPDSKGGACFEWSVPLRENHDS